MYLKVHECNETIPANGTLDSYTGIKATTCSFCDAMCKTQNITTEINFFDGFNGTATIIVYCSIVAFSIIFELFR